MDACLTGPPSHLVPGTHRSRYGTLPWSLRLPVSCGTAPTGDGSNHQSPITIHQSRVWRERPMKLGFFTMPMHPPSRNYTQTLKEDREAVILADRLGFSDALIGEHVTDVCESIPSCL